MSAKASAGEVLDIRGAGVEVFENTSGSWLAQHGHRMTFPGNSLLERPVPESVSFDILTRDGRYLDAIHGTYGTERCSCSVPDGIDGLAGR